MQSRRLPPWAVAAIAVASALGGGAGIRALGGVTAENHQALVERVAALEGSAAQVAELERRVDALERLVTRKLPRLIDALEKRVEAVSREEFELRTLLRAPRGEYPPGPGTSSAPPPEPDNTGLREGPDVDQLERDVDELLHKVLQTAPAPQTAEEKWT